MQKPKANSRKAHAPNTKANTKANSCKLSNKLMIIAVEKRIPMRAAKTFGPSLTRFFSSFSLFSRNFEVRENGLYFENCKPRIKKSAHRIITGTIFWVIIKMSNNNTVNAALARATRSSILWVEIGQKAFEFISV